jgi:hypothetical protein
MDTKIIDNIQTISFFENIPFFAPTGEFTLPININFIPDVVIVKSLMYEAAAAENVMTVLWSDLINDILGSFTDARLFNTETMFILYKKPIRGTYKFEIRDSAGTVNNGRQGDLFFQLQFVKYREVSEKKLL